MNNPGPIVNIVIVMFSVIYFILLGTLIRYFLLILSFWHSVDFSTEVYSVILCTEHNKVAENALRNWGHFLRSKINLIISLLELLHQTRIVQSREILYAK